MSAIGNLAGTLLHAVLPINLFPNNSTASSAGSSTASNTQLPDTGKLTSFGQLASTLQQLLQSNPSQYAQVTQKISANLQSAAQTAQTGGNTAAASQLNQLSADFSSASATGQLPSLQDLAKASGGGHGLHHRFADALQSIGAQGNSSNAAAIIQNTLTSAGVSLTS